MHTKKIHYCWFGSDLPVHQKEYIKEWKEKFPDFDIIHWNENNIPRGGDYVERVLKAQKWAFLADYVRLYALYNFGGIYFDTDVKVINNFEHELTSDIDCLLGHECEPSSGFNYVGTAVIAAQKGSPLIKEFMDKYDKRLGNMMARNDRITGPRILTPILEKKGLTSADQQDIGAVRILSKELIYPAPGSNLDNCYTIHDGAATWRKQSKSFSDKLYKKKRKLFDKAKELFGQKI